MTGYEARMARAAGTAEGAGARDAFVEFTAFLALLTAFGFPGGFGTRFLGGRSATLFEWSAFLMEILAMVLPKSGGWRKAGFTLFDRRFVPAYLAVGVIFVDSMLVTDTPKEQFVSCFRLSVTAAFGVWMALELGAAKTADLAVKAQVVFMAASLILWLANPDAATSMENGTRDFIGILETKNTFGAEVACCVALHCVSWRSRRERGEKPRAWAVFLLGGEAAALVASNATAATLTAVAAFLALFVEERFPKVRDLNPGAAYCVSSAGFLVAAIGGTGAIAPIVEALGKKADLTGRVPLWKQILSAGMSGRPWTGYGYANFWSNKAAVARIRHAFRSTSFMGRLSTGSHNATLELWLNVGFIGVAAYWLAFVLAFRNVKRMRRVERLFVLAFFFTFAVHGFTERAFFTFDYHTLLTFAAMGLGMAAPGKPFDPRRNLREGVPR